MILLSIFSFCAQTHKSFQVQETFIVFNSTELSPTGTVFTTSYSAASESNNSVTTNYSGIQAPDDDSSGQHTTGMM